jgi:CTP:molybdopterin cytidylyltransferase MocA
VDCNHYILAAGRGQRAGGPKAWQVHEGKSLLERHVDFLRHRVPAKYIAVSIQEEWLQRCHALQEDIHWVPANPDMSPLSSLQLLAQQLPLTRWTFLYHVDMPLWSASVFTQLQSAISSPSEGSDGDKAEAIVPTYRGRGGHPILLSPRLAVALQKLDPRQDRLDHWLRQRQTTRCEVTDSIIHQNWNRGEPDTL